MSRNYLNTLRDEIYKNAVEKGWWDEERSFGDVILVREDEGRLVIGSDQKGVVVK